MYYQSLSSSSSFSYAATKIQGAFRNHQARLKLKNEVVWKIHEKLEYSNEQTEAKLRDMFEKLLKASDLLSPSITKLLQTPGLSLEEKELLKLTNPDNIHIEANYQGLHIESPIKRSTFVDLIETFQKGKSIEHDKIFLKLSK
ncbi:unnamed protein product [Rotaria sordida]|uniref:Uncharacterized protein n=1 Tax=Rotaria sordida TaxID=392033 RepID=A0A816G4Z8_9BILA|nr:unnamed protein product [Rotaria sordida]CAF1669279.1 unnamed protein product [Rotaria sordida]